MELAELLQHHRDKILQLAKQHGAYNIKIFGSVARGEATEDSDIDFLIELESGRSLIDRIALIQDLEDLLGRKVDVPNLKGLREFCRDRILQEAIPLSATIEST
jgi:predicted nucleotidyltransferase